MASKLFRGAGWADEAKLESFGFDRHLPSMQTVQLSEAAARLAELVQSLAPGEEIVVKSGDQAVAKITSAKPRPSLLDLEPVSLGAMLRPFPHPDDDLLDEMRNPR